MTAKNGAGPGTVAGVRVAIVAAFTVDGAGGNLAGVVLDAGGLPSAQRRRIAAAVALSETAFVEARADRVYAVEFYTPTAQVPDCGHASVATFRLVADRDGDAPMTKLTTIGPRAMTIDGDLVVMEQPRPAFTPQADGVEVAAALGLDPADVGAPVVAENGVRFLLVPVRDAAALRRAAPDAARIGAHSERIDVYGYYVYAPGASGIAATARMFAPRIAIPEEPATGMAGGMLGAFLAGRDERELRIEQGALSPRPSRSEIVVRPRADAVAVGGRATLLEMRTVADA